MKKVIAMLFFIVLSSCDQGGGSSSPTPTVNASTCATLPSGIVIDPASICTTVSGKWTKYTVSTMAFQSCDNDETSLYLDQADFNANEGTSVVAGINITSNNDFVKTDTCSSGSIVYETGGMTTNYLFIWEKVP